MAILLIRTVLLYFLILLAMKAMGKRQIGQLQPFELVAIIIISDMASLAMQSTNASLTNSIIPIAVITIMQISLSLLNLKSEKTRRFLCGQPVIIISKGKIQEENMKKIRINLNDLQELIRAQGYFDLSSIENAVMETNGQLSIMPKTQERPLKTGDLTIKLPREEMGLLLILDGHINHKALQYSGYNEQWLQKQLTKARVDNIAQLFVAGLDEDGNFFWQKKNKGR